MIIPFRSKNHSKIIYWLSKNQKNQYWTEFSHITKYTPNNDSKNIFWKKSTREYEIFEKNFSDNSNFSIIFCVINNNWDDFFDTIDKKSRWLWKKESIFHLEFSAKKLGISHQTIISEDINTVLEKLIKKGIKNNLIIIINNDNVDKYQKNISKISKINELMIIKPYHPFELDPNKDSIFLWKIFNTKLKKKYLNEIDEIDKNNKKILTNLKIPFIKTNTKIPIDYTLYNFFKYKYE